jgi:hypothetical protein
MYYPRHTYTCPTCQAPYFGATVCVGGDTAYFALIHSHRPLASSLWTIWFHLHHRELHIDTQRFANCKHPDDLIKCLLLGYYVYVDFIKAPRFYLHEDRQGKKCARFPPDTTGQILSRTGRYDHH